MWGFEPALLARRELPPELDLGGSAGQLLHRLARHVLPHLNILLC